MTGQPAPAPESRPAGWTATIVAVLVLAAVAAVVVPQMGGGLTTSEREAVSVLKLIRSAQADFKANDLDENKAFDYWIADVAGLHYGLKLPRGRECLDRRIADADGAPRDTSRERRPHMGYWFAMMRQAGNDRSTYAVCAYPAAYPHEGRRTFIAAQEGDVWMKDAGGASVSQWPANPESEGWTRVEP